MGYKPLAKLGQQRQQHRTLDVPIAGPQSQLPEGEHEVTITDVDLSSFTSQGCLDIVFKGLGGATHRQRLWTVSRYDSSQYDRALVELVNALFQDPSIFMDLDEVIADEHIQESAFQTFRGMKLGIITGRTQGYVTELMNNQYVLLDSNTRERLDPREFSTLAQAREVAVTKKLRRSWYRVRNYKALSDDTLVRNREAFNAAIEGLRAATQAVGDTRIIFNPNAFRTASEKR